MNTVCAEDIPFSADYIERQLKEAGISLPVQVEDKVDSTNELLKHYASQGERRDMVLFAREQSAGKGRRGRSFFSPEGTGLYMSLLLHPAVTVEQAAALTTLAAAAQARAVEEVSGQSVQIKWVNDVWMRGRKISGILTECSPTLTDGRPEYVIVGIGINLFEPAGGFPEELRDVAGAVFLQEDKMHCGQDLRGRLAVQLLLRFMEYYRTFPGKEYLEEYRKRCFVIGKRVQILTPEHAERSGLRTGDSADSAGVQERRKQHSQKQTEQDRICAVVLGINEECHLHVQYEDGTTEYLSGGEISVRTEEN